MSNQNPASEIKARIVEFDRILSSSGANNTSDVINRAGKSEVESDLSAIDKILQNMPIGKAVQYYSQLEDITAEVIARTHEEVCFNQLKLPDIPVVGHDSSESIRGFITYLSKVSFLIQPLIEDEVGSRKKNNFFSAIENKKKILNKGFFMSFQMEI
ncbi:hypothetical protein [Shewanella sp.]|uniref:hypothetical protein n=1 Tax=Shewanella sp. TaxID=50422 RepID=UPI003A84D0ED